MNLRTRTRIGRLRRRRSQWGRFLLALTLLVMAYGLQAPDLVPAALAQPSSGITFRVNSIGATVGGVTYSTPGTIDGFTYLVNEDNTGDPSDPDPANHPSLRPMPSHSPVIDSGTVATGNLVTLSLPDGRYLLSVRADGHKLGGVHFRLPDDAGKTLDVDLVNGPLPLSKIRVHVFHDNHPVNGEDDIPMETGLAGFSVVVEDTMGEVTVDWFGNPICTEYLDFPGGTPKPGTGGVCVTDANGNVIIDNLPRGKYEILAIPPDGSGWIQTTTIEGTHVIDAWIEEGNDGYAPREGFQVAMVWVGFVKEMNWGDPGSIPPGTGTIRGTVRTMVEWTPPVNPLVLGEPVDQPWIALTNIGGNDEQVYLGRGNPDGSFQINNVPDGVYQMAIWDEPLDYIISFYTVTIPEDPLNDTDGDLRTVDMDARYGGVPIPRWFGWLSGYVFQDDGLDGSGNPIPPGVGLDSNGIRDCANPADPSTCERGISLIDLDTRFRDGSIQYTTLTDGSGFYEFPEVFELEKFAVLEVGFGRFARTGIALHDELDPSIVTPLASDLGGDLLAAELTWAAKRRIVDFGKRDYAPGENGGISGVVQYATTRNEFNARFAAAEDYEPGIPNVTMRLWGLGPDEEPNTADDVLLNEVQSDAWQHPTGCDVLDSSGNPLPDPLGLGPGCIEVPNISNEVKDGAFDGGYAFESYWAPYFGAPGAVEVDGLPPGDYVVEVVIPDGYQIVKEEDLNTAEGNDLVPQIPPPVCVGDLHLADVPDEYGSPYDGQMMPLCNKRQVTLQEGQNAAADFFLFTSDGANGWTSDQAVPIPGRIFGFLLDDLNVETNPDFIYYGEKRGIPNAPVGIRDFTGRLITTVQSDENGIFEVLLPSTYVADCPIPSGVCPQMYRVVGNDPGDPDNPNPNYNPNYQTLTFVFDVWPGKTTFADVALFPITAFHNNDIVGSQFQQPAQCVVPDETPQIWSVSPPYVNGSGAITITGTGFGAVQGDGEVTIDGLPLPVNNWSDTTLDVTVPAGFPAGPGQLLVAADNGRVSSAGLTFHVLGGSYNPTVVEVDPPVNPATGTPIQDAIDAASGDTLIVVRPGTYYLGPLAGVEGGGLVLNKGVKLQGYGPGEPPFGTGGSVIDQRFVLARQGINVVAASPGTFSAAFNPQIDGFRITAARDEQDVGGGIHVDVNGQYLEISNNVIQSNGGNFGGGIILGEPYRGDNNNDNIHIHHNRILNNGGWSLAGGIGIFNGADNYEIDHNEICGNYSGEYGGGISHFGLSPGGSIHHNRVYFNGAFDEGGGIMIAGEQPVVNPEDPGETPPVTQGSGGVDIYNNLVQANMSNDDGGGIRLLQPWDYPVTIVNNMIVNNVSTDFGGGIALDDASDVTIINNTIARNANTSTAEDSDGLPHAAGLAVEDYSAAFTAYLISTYGSAAPGFVDPLMFNNIFWENKAYTWDGTALVFDSFIDLEVFGTSGGTLSPTYSLLTVPYGPGDPTNIVGSDPLFVSPYDTVLDAVAFRMEPFFITVVIVTVDLPPALLGDYHLGVGSPAIDAGAAAVSGVNAPGDDIDGDPRPQDAAYEIGADETAWTSIPMFKGLNLISLPLAQNGAAGSGPATLGRGGRSPAELLASIEGKYERVYAYLGCDAADPWKVYDPTVPDTVSDLDAIDHAIGLWVKMKRRGTLKITGIEPTQTNIPLCAGWNLIGYPASVARPVEDVLAPIATQVKRVFHYDASDSADHWKMYDPNVPKFVSDLATFEPGDGYWILVTENTVLTIVN